MDAHGEELDLVRMSFRECSRNNENEYGTELGEALVVLSYSAMGVLGQRHAWRGGGMENAAPRPLENKYIGTGGKTKWAAKESYGERDYRRKWRCEDRIGCSIWGTRTRKLVGGGRGIVREPVERRDSGPMITDSEIDLIRQANKWSDWVSRTISSSASYNQLLFLLLVRCFPRLVLPRRPP